MCIKKSVGLPQLTNYMAMKFDPTSITMWVACPLLWPLVLAIIAVYCIEILCRNIGRNVAMWDHHSYRWAIYVSLNQSHRFMAVSMVSCRVILFIPPASVSVPKSSTYIALTNCLCQILEFICYDDGCHLRKFAQNPTRRNISGITNKLAEIERSISLW